MIVIISDESSGKLGVALKEAAGRAGAQVVHFAANTLHIKPCAASDYFRIIIMEKFNIFFLKSGNIIDLNIIKKSICKRI